MHIKKQMVSRRIVHYAVLEYNFVQYYIFLQMLDYYNTAIV